TENSTRMRSRPRTVAGSPAMGTPTRPTPATSPASLPSAACPGASSAPTRRSSASVWRSATRRLPMRPAAPATTTSAIGDAESALEEAERREHRFEALAIRVAHAAHGQAKLRLDHAQHRHRLLDRDGVRLHEHRAGERVELPVELARLLPVAGERRVGHLHGL